MSEGAGEEAAPVDEEGVEEFRVFEAEDDFVVTVEGGAGEVVGTGDDELASDALPFGVDGHVFRVDGLVAPEGDAGGFEEGGDFRGGFAGVDEDGDVHAGGVEGGEAGSDGGAHVRPCGHGDADAASGAGVDAAEDFEDGVVGSGGAVAGGAWEEPCGDRGGAAGAAVVGWIREAGGHVVPVAEVGLVEVRAVAEDEEVIVPGELEFREIGG